MLTEPARRPVWHSVREKAQLGGEVGAGQADRGRGSPRAQPTRAATCSQHQQVDLLQCRDSAGLPAGRPAYQTPTLVVSGLPSGCRAWAPRLRPEAEGRSRVGTVPSGAGHRSTRAHGEGLGAGAPPAPSARRADLGEAPGEGRPLRSEVPSRLAPRCSGSAPLQGGRLPAHQPASATWC